MNSRIPLILTCLCSAFIPAAQADTTDSHPDDAVLVPKIVGDWWQIAGTPELGEYAHEDQQPVDFGIWQAADGTWQVWSCIRKVNTGGNRRLFHGWEGKSLTDTDWKPLGVTMVADTSLGEVEGGLQAPHVIIKDGIYHMLYGSWDGICLATSEDGKTFTRVINESGTPELFRGPKDNPRDPMTILVGDTYYCYYVAHDWEPGPGPLQSAIYCRTSQDLHNWSEPAMVCGGGSPAEPFRKDGGWWDAECPFVVQVEGQFVLFRNQIYGSKALNTQYLSDNPLYFGVNEDSRIVSQLNVAAPEIIKDGDQYYIVALNPRLDGIRMARLEFVREKRAPSAGPESAFRRNFESIQLTAEGAWVERFSMYSECMDRDIRVAVVLPPAYETAAEKEFPILHTLHGANAPYDTYANMARLRAQLKEKPFIYTCFDGDAGSRYIDSPYPIRTARRGEDDETLRLFRFTTFFFDEFIPAIDEWYRTDSSRRGVTGFSMGGGGAFHYMLEHPEMFTSVSGLSSAFYNSQDENGFGGRRLESRLGSREEFPERYLAIDHYDRFRKHLEAGSPLPAIFFHCGAGDRLLDLSREMSVFLNEIGVDYQYLETPGEHNWAFWHPASVGIAEFHWQYFKN